jgi:hypothetical protein
VIREYLSCRQEIKSLRLDRRAQHTAVPMGDEVQQPLASLNMPVQHDRTTTEADIMSELRDAYGVLRTVLAEVLEGLRRRSVYGDVLAPWGSLNLA